MVAGNLIAKLQLVFGNLGLNIPANRTIPYLHGSMELKLKSYCISQILVASCCALSSLLVSNAWSYLYVTPNAAQSILHYQQGGSGRQEHLLVILVVLLVGSDDIRTSGCGTRSWHLKQLRNDDFYCFRYVEDSLKESR